MWKGKRGGDREGMIIWGRKGGRTRKRKGKGSREAGRAWERDGGMCGFLVGGGLKEERGRDKEREGG